MIRVGTVLTLSLAVAAGIGLYHAKYRVQALELELGGLQQQILAHREAIHVLKAEWSFLNDPQRLAEISRRHLELAPVSGSQLAKIDDVPEKLPLPEPDPAEPQDGAPLIASAPAPVPVAAAVPVGEPATPKAADTEPPFTELPADVQAILASMRSAQ